MLNAAILLTGKTNPGFIHSLTEIPGVEWGGFYSPENKNTPDLGNLLLFPSAEILPKIADLLVVLNPEYCNYEYLSGAIRNGCHLFLTDKLKLSLEERNALIHLAKEGNTHIEIRNSFRGQTLRRKIQKAGKNGTFFLEITDSAAFEEGNLEKRLVDNLHLIFTASGSPVQRFDVFCGSAPILRPDIIHIYIKFFNRSTASLKLIFNEEEPLHEMKIYQEGELTKYNLLQNSELETESESLLITEQVQEFITNVQTRNTSFFGLMEEIEIYLLMKKIREKLDLYSLTC